MATNLGRIGTSSMGATRKPPLRTFSAACADSNLGDILLGGLQNHLSVVLNDTWSYDAGTLRAWVSRVVTTTPAARYLHSLAYDSNTGFAILFGGTDGTVKSDTVEWSGTDWATQSPGTVPAARSGHACCLWNNSLLLFSGVLIWGGENSSGTLLQDGYAYDQSNHNWTSSTGSTPPSARKWHVMVRVTNNGGLVHLFGGRDGSGAVANFYTRAALGGWTLRATASAPTARQQHAACDWNGAGTKGMLMFGGDNGSGTLNAETWILNRTGATYNWFQQSPTNSPTARKGHAMWNDLSGNAYLMGGNDGTNDLYDIWQWNGTNWLRLF